VFIPLFLIAFWILESSTRAFVLAATFTGGAMLGFFLGVLAGNWLIHTQPQENASLLLLITFASASAVAGGAIAVWLLGRLSGSTPWRRD
jgi:hypothetical protein